MPAELWLAVLRLVALVAGWWSLHPLIGRW
jgi:hypothetical protein